MTKIVTNFIRLNSVMEISGLSKSTIYRLSKIGKFPKPIKLGPRAIGWASSDIEFWVENKIKQR